MIQFQNEGKKIIDFLTELSENNTKLWFDEHKKDFDLIHKDFKRIINELSQEIHEFDTSLIPAKAETYIFRIYKDLRFSKEKIPYKTHLAAYICNGGRKSPKAGYYIHFEPNNSFIAGGVYKPPTPIIQSVRQEIYFSHKEFFKIIENKDFINLLDGLMDDKLNKVPKDFPNNHPASEHLKYKSLIASKNFSNTEVLKSDFFDTVIHTFKALQPLNTFINNSIDLIDQ